MKKIHWVILGIIIISVLTGVYFTQMPVLDFLSSKIIESINLTLVMAWETWWALVLGFAVAGAVEAWITKEKIIEYLKGAGLKELGLGSFFGFISSSCSYSAIATAKNLFKKGASAAASLGAFMFASTNLVIEIGIVIWILLGWQFVLANFIGGLILIVLMSLGFELLVPGKIIEEARDNVIQNSTTEDPVCGMKVDPKKAKHKSEYNGETYYFCSSNCKKRFEHQDQKSTEKSIKEHIMSLKGWTSLAKKQLKEWRMLYEDIIIGFVLAGIIGAFIPDDIWVALFSGQAVLGLPVYIIWTSAVGAIIGVITFVCSVGNVPFAAILWNSGLPFGSVLSYIYADLIVPPIVDAYRKYYGKKFAAILSFLIFIAAVVAGVIIHFGFLGFNLIPSGQVATIERSIKFNYKAWLNGLFTIIFFGLFWLSKKGNSS
ncbi:MAG: permease [Candidatus Magasanikbacteria bacterium]